MITGDMITPGTCIKYKGDHGVLHTGIVAFINKMTIKDGMILILENDIYVSILDVLEISDEKEDKKDMCLTCYGTGVLNGSGGILPTIACSNCHGSGKYYYQNEENTCPKCENYLCTCEDKKEDMVNSPKHYTFGTIEVIAVIEDWGLGFHEGNCIKYIARAKHKGNELEDLKKAQWYLNRRIEQLEKE